MRCCANCEWWKPFDEGEINGLSDGECHRYPPRVPCVNRVNDLGVAIFETVRGSILMTYPVMYAPEWCGEFRTADFPRVEEDE